MAKKNKTNEEWNAIAQSLGFKDMEEAKEWQRTEGRKWGYTGAADGKLGESRNGKIGSADAVRRWRTSQLGKKSKSSLSTKTPSLTKIVTSQMGSPEQKKQAQDELYTESYRTLSNGTQDYLSDKEILEGRNKVNKKKKQNKSQNQQEQNQQEQNKVSTFASNFIKSPVQALVDYVLWQGDRLGLPSNATNMLRDWNATLPYRTSSAIRAGFNTMFNDEDFMTNYNRALANPSFYENLKTIHPLSNDNKNYSQEELDIINRMRSQTGAITNSDIKRETSNNSYGGNAPISDYFSPERVVQTSIGQSSGKNGVTYDVFDVNTLSDVAKHDNDMYMNMAKDNPGFNYATLRAVLPYIGATDVMPDYLKIHTQIK